MKRYSTQLLIILLVLTMANTMAPEITTQQANEDVITQKQEELRQVTEALMTQCEGIEAKTQKNLNHFHKLKELELVKDQLNQAIQQLENKNKDVAQQELNALTTEIDTINDPIQEIFESDQTEQYFKLIKLERRKAQLEAELTQVNLPMIVKKSTVEQGFFSRGWHWLASTRPARLFGWCKNLVWPNTKVMNKMKVRDEKIYQFQLPTALPESIATNAMTLRDLRNAAQKIEAASYARGTRLALLALGYGLFEAYRHNVLTQIPTLGGTAKAVALLAGGYVATMQLFPRIHNRWYNTSRININTLAGQYSHAVKATGLVTNKIAEDAGNQYVKRANIMDTVEPNKKIAAANKAKRDKIQAFFNGMVAAPRPAQS